MADRDPQVVSGIVPIPAIATAPSGTTPVAPITRPAAAVPNTSSARGKVPAVEVGVYWIERYARPSCKQPELDHCKTLATSFTKTMRLMGHKIAFERGDADANPRQWDAWGDVAQNGIDTVEFALIATHSMTIGKERPLDKFPTNPWLYYFVATFDHPQGCWVSTIKVILVERQGINVWEPPDAANPVVNMRLGERRLRWLVLESCFSLQVGIVNLPESLSADDWKAEKIELAMRNLAASNPSLTWSRCFDGVNLIFGFTGLSSDYAGTNRRTGRFARRIARGEPMGDTWIDEAHSSSNDDVPVVLGCGVSEADASKRVNTESLKARSAQLHAPNIGGYAWIWRI